MCYFDDKQDSIARLQCIMYLLHHSPVELRIRLMNPRRIVQHHLRSRMSGLALDFLFQRNFEHPMDTCAGRLRFVRDDGKLLPEQGIQQRRLARIRATDDRDETGAKGPFPLLCAVTPVAIATA